METYTLNVAGLTRELPICAVNESLDIAAFIMYSDIELTVECAKALLAKVPEFDVILTAASKGIPLAYEAARQSGKPYFVANKSRKIYMGEPISAGVRSITTLELQTLYLAELDAKRISGKRVLILDDVISTGGSLSAMEQVVKKAGGIIAASAAVLAEGEAADRGDIIFLEKLPLFPRKI